MNAEYKRNYMAQMSDYHKAKRNERAKKIYHSLSPDKIAELVEKRKVYYQANKERIRLRQLEYYHANKDK